MFQVAIHTGNAAFDGDNLFPEVARILRDIADAVDGGMMTVGRARDINGNIVGDFHLERD